LSKPKWISFDLETLGVKATSVILSIGAVAFNETELFQEVKVNLNIDEQLRWGRTIDGSTLLFWFQQSDKARVAATMAPVQVAKALNVFGGLIQGVGPKTLLWANGQDFDLGILGNLYDTVGMARPWVYNAGRDMRTLIDITGKPDIKFEGEQHDALADAKHQAKVIQAALKMVKK
jgi:hypothetical protein